MLDDLKLAGRRLRRSPWFTVAAVLTLALSIGMNTAIFSIADAVLFRPLPYREPDRVFVVSTADRTTGRRYTQVRHEQLRLLEEHHRGLGPAGLAESGPEVIADGPDGPERVPTLAVSARYFEILGVRAARGRLFDLADEARAGRVAVLSHAAWQSRFGGDEGVIGRSLALGAATFDVVGVLPAAFVFPTGFAGRPDVVTVLAPVAAGEAGGTFHPVVRLEPGVTREQAQTEIDRLAAHADPAARSRLVLDDVRSVLYPAGRPVMVLSSAASALVLLVGCANLALMLLARGRRGERDDAVRVALGAGTWRVVRPLIVEAALIGLAGGVLALLATAVTFDTLLSQVPRLAYGDAPVGVDARVAVFAFALALLGGAVFAAVPAWRLGGLDILPLIQRGGGGMGARGRFGRPLLVVQVAAAVALVFGAIVTARAFLSVLDVPLGFAPEGVLTVKVRPRGLPMGHAWQAFYVRAAEAIAARSEVISVGAVGSAPLDGSMHDEPVVTADSARPAAGIDHVLPGYFETVGLRRVRGRLLAWQDVRSGTDAVVVSESAARVLFPGRDPVGQVLTAGRGRSRHVVGVVADVRRTMGTGSSREDTPPVYAVPGEATRSMTLVVRMRDRRPAAVAGIRRDLASLAPGAPVTIQWWSDSIRRLAVYQNPRFQTLLLGAFAALALGLTALGVFGVVAFVTSRRTREMGIRAAIGASPGSLVGLMVSEALTPIAIGLCLGILATRWAARLAEAQLFDVQARDPLVVLAAGVTVTIAAAVAAYLPARQAGRVDPVIALRTE